MTRRIDVVSSSQKTTDIESIHGECREMSTDRLTLLSAEVIQALRREYPAIPDDYFEHMQSIGWGEQDNGHMIYEGPTQPSNVYGERLADSSILLLGDPFIGFLKSEDVAVWIEPDLSDDLVIPSPQSRWLDQR